MAAFSLSGNYPFQKMVVSGPIQTHTSVRVGSFRPVRASAACATTPAKTSSFYDVLGVQAGATFREVKSAYRRLARVLHPDVVASSSTQRGDTDREFMKIHEAYSTLSNPEKRADYDRMLLDRRLKAVGVRSEPSISVYPTAVKCYPASGFSGYTRRRTWETDQCW